MTDRTDLPFFSMMAADAATLPLESVHLQFLSRAGRLRSRGTYGQRE